MSEKPPAKRSNFDKLPMDLINKISDMNRQKPLPDGILITTVVKVTCRDRGITITHIFDVVHEDKVLKRTMPGGFVKTYLRQFRDSDWYNTDLYSTTKIQSQLYLDEVPRVIERYKVSMNLTLGANPETEDWEDDIKEECRDIRSHMSRTVIDFNRDHELMGLKCEKIKRRVIKAGASAKVFEVESYYHPPKKKKKVKVSDELSFYNFKF